MLIYVFLAVLIFISAFWGNKNIWNKIVVVLLCLCGLLRGKTVGDDVHTYLLNIRHTTWSSLSWNYATNFEPGYNFLIALWNSISDNGLLFLGMNNVIFVLAVNYFGRKQTRHYNLFLLFIYFLGYYVQSFNIMRQYFAISIILFFISNLELENLKRRDLLYISLITIVVGLLFHNTILSVLAIPFYYLFQNTPINKRKYFVLVILISFVIFYLDIIRNILSNYSSQFILNEKATVYYQQSFNKDEEVYSLVRIVIDNLFLLYLIYIHRKIDVFIFILTFSQVFVNLFAPLNVLFIRIPIILFIISVPFYVKLWYKHDYVTKSIILSYAIIMFVNILIKNYGQFQPYLFYWE